MVSRICAPEPTRDYASWFTSHEVLSLMRRLRKMRRSGLEKENAIKVDTGRSQWAPRDSEPTVFIDGLIAASILNDPAGVRDQLDCAVAALGFGRCVDEVLLPALRSIGVLWSQGRFDVEAERLTSETIRGWLDRLALAAPQPDQTPPVVLACGPGERHSIGLESLRVLLRQQRRACRMLGSRTSTRSLAIAVRANKPSGVVLASHLRSGRPAAAQALRTVAAMDPAVALFYGGGAFASVRLRRNLPGTYLGTHIQTACAAVIAATERGEP